MQNPIGLVLQHLLHVFRTKMHPVSAFPLGVSYITTVGMATQVRPSIAPSLPPLSIPTSAAASLSTLATNLENGDTSTPKTLMHMNGLFLVFSTSNILPATYSYHLNRPHHRNG
ncbi:hypothetical protein MIND_01327700 [Mycena indigotica]|uniref:Uncharacterized protein n=1 Tax=Mycena indigotica TaxID=2126181 RepID=A0A8H6S0T1_9AGAR|nr:uncharacterized protein MIND_01327700 [Mycena indigotica]KAF7290145.1 hypothetical protein MIND_01327700 [Mycena indigotica]